MGAPSRRISNLFETAFDGFAAFTGFYYSKKYAAIVKRLGLRPAEGPLDRPGLVIIQVDGLSYEHLQKALAKGRLPHLQRLFERGSLTLTPYRCGLPSTTPAAQAGIMFGANDGIPAFRWYDKSSHRSVVVKFPDVAASLQRQVSNGRQGILHDGASYLNIFDGGAASSLFTLSAMEPRRLFSNVRGLGFVALFLLNPLRTLRILWLSLVEYAIDFAQRVSCRLKGKPYPSFVGMFPLFRVFSNVILREIATFAVLVDVYRGVPAIYANYYAWDEMAHNFGVESLAAHRTLRGIDGCIDQIERMTRANLNRPYALHVLSDHGMTDSEPFAHRYGETIGSLVAAQLGGEVRLVEHGGEPAGQLARAELLDEELKAVEKNLPRPMARLIRRTRTTLRRRLERKLASPDWNLEKSHDVVVKSSGSLAHVYLNICDRRMDLSEVTEAYPWLVPRLLAHPGIWFIVAREGAETLVMSEKGYLRVNGDGSMYVDGQNPLHALDDPSLAAQQLRRIASFQPSGDLMLLGTYDPAAQKVVCFEHQWASHGGLGGAQDLPFIAYPEGLPFDPAQVVDSRGLYDLFIAQR